jgi:hypothetical protein
MKRYSVSAHRACLALAGILFTASISVKAERTGFDDVPTGASPPGWTATRTGGGDPKWTVVPDASAPSQPNALEQSGIANFPVAVKDDSRIVDGFVEVKFKPISGKDDQAGGVVWRYLDADNYYICRANALENNVVLYRVYRGKRKSISPIGRLFAYGVGHPVPAGQWHTLRVEFQGTRAKVLFNGKALFEIQDKTFPGPGKVGVWTKADSVTRFDDFAYGSK